MVECGNTDSCNSFFITFVVITVVQLSCHIKNHTCASATTIDVSTIFVILCHILCFHITSSLVLCHSYPNPFIYIKLQNILVVYRDVLFFLYSLMANNVAEICSSWYYL